VSTSGSLNRPLANTSFRTEASLSQPGTPALPCAESALARSADARSAPVSWTPAPSKRPASGHQYSARARPLAQQGSQTRRRVILLVPRSHVVAAPGARGPATPMHQEQSRARRQDRGSLALETQLHQFSGRSGCLWNLVRLTRLSAASRRASSSETEPGVSCSVRMTSDHRRAAACLNARTGLCCQTAALGSA
jgi:hypothetical protein